MEKKLKTSEYVVAFIDVLGASIMIDTDADGSLNAIHKTFQNAMESFKKAHEVVDFDISIFSDNIVIAKQVTEDDYFEKSFYYIQILSAIVQIHFLKKGILIRGGIAHGNFFQDELMVWGQALVQSHYLESKVAIFPRIVVDPQLIKESCIEIEEMLHSEFLLKQDNDDLLFIDYLRDSDKAKDLILRELAGQKDKETQFEKKPDVLQKYGWHYSYLKGKLAEGNADEQNEE